LTKDGFAIEWDKRYEEGWMWPETLRWLYTTEKKDGERLVKRRRPKRENKAVLLSRKALGGTMKDDGKNVSITKKSVAWWLPVATGKRAIAKSTFKRGSSS